MKNPAHTIRDFWTCFRHVTAGFDSVIEFGCGHGNNLRRTPCAIKVGVELIADYTQMNPTQDVKFIVGDAIEEAKKILDRSFDLVMLIDVVEHFHNTDGITLLNECKRIARHRVLVWMPEGYMRQDEQVYNAVHSEYKYFPSQNHIGSWYKKDLQAMGFDTVRWENYHPDRETGKGIPALFAIWNRDRNSFCGDV